MDQATFDIESARVDRWRKLEEKIARASQSLQCLQNRTWSASAGFHNAGGSSVGRWLSEFVDKDDVRNFYIESLEKSIAEMKKEMESL